MTDEEVKAYALYLMEGRCQEVEWLTIFELWGCYAGYDTELTEDDADRVDRAIASAKVEITW